MNAIKFGTGGFRGVIGEDFTQETTCGIAEALSQIIEEEGAKKEIVVGYDRRRNSPETAKMMAKVFTSHGIHVFLTSTECPTPCVIYHVAASNCDYGVMITASHNPATFNGVKVFTKGGYDADEAFTNRLERKYLKVESVPTTFDESLITTFEALTPYVNHALSFSKPHLDRPLRIAYDNLYGTGVTTIVPALEKLGLKDIKVFHPEHDCNFGGLLPNPLEVNLMGLKQFVTQEHYDVGFSADSDADRLAVLDENGRFVTANEILGCIYYYLVKVRGLKGDVVRNLATSQLLDDLAKQLGQTCHEVDVGFKNITSEMTRVDALLGGESSGGLTMRGYLKGKDTTFALLLFVNMMDDMKMPVSQIVKEVKAFAHYPSFDYESFVTYPKWMEQGIEAYFEERSPSFVHPVIKREKIGRNIRYWFNDHEWALLRLSNTEPAIRIYLEIDDFALLKEEETRIQRFVAELGESK